jgi:hypothetical protein
VSPKNWYQQSYSGRQLGAVLPLCLILSLALALMVQTTLASAVLTHRKVFNLLHAKGICAVELASHVHRERDGNIHGGPPGEVDSSVANRESLLAEAMVACKAASVREP